MRIAYNEYIYESVILEGYTSADILRLYGNKLKEQIANEKNEDVENIQDTEVNQLIQHIEQADPSSDKKWLGSIATWLLGKRLEDLDAQIKPNLQQFKELLEQNPGKFGPVSKNIAKGKMKYDDFVNVVYNKEVKPNATTEIKNYDNKASRKLAADRISKKVSNFKQIGENTDYVMYYIDKWEQGEGDKHICFSGKVEWCVRAKQYFDQYKPPYYYILSKLDGREYALMHLDSNQLKNVKDNRLTLEEFNPIADIILPVMEKYLSETKTDFAGDFKVIETYLDEHDDILENYPTIKEVIKANKIKTLFRTHQYDDLLELEESIGLDYSRISSHVMHYLVTDRTVPGRLIDAILTNETFDVNCLVLDRHSIILAAKAKNKYIIDSLLNNSRFSYDTMNRKGYNLFSGIKEYYTGMGHEYAEYLGTRILAKIPKELFEDDVEISADNSDSNQEVSCDLIVNQGLVECFSVFLKRGFSPTFDEWDSMAYAIISRAAVKNKPDESLVMLQLLADANKVDWKHKDINGDDVLMYIDSFEPTPAVDKIRSIIQSKL